MLIMTKLSRDETILVTGAAGFIGSALIQELNRRGFRRIFAVDYLDNSDRYRNLVPLQFLDYIEADDFLAAIQQRHSDFASVSKVFHLGACSSTIETDGRYLIKNNFEYTKLLCRWTLEKNARFVYASSAATYGDGSRGMDDTMESICKLLPLNMYGYSKQLFDVHALRRGFLQNIYGLKYFNVFGPNEFHKGDMASMVLKAFDQIQTEGRTRLFRSYHPDYADGEQQRDFLYIKDAVDMTLFFGDLPARNSQNNPTGGLFNLGSGKASTWLELVRPIFKVLQVPEQIDFVEMPAFLRPRYQYFTCANIQRLRDVGYGKKIRPLTDAVTDYVANYLIPHQRLGENSSDWK